MASKIGLSISKLYTMAQERTVHQGIIPADSVVAASVAAANDDELFADALF